MENISSDRHRLESVLELLEETDEPEARADLADEAVRLCARYEDLMERVIYRLACRRPDRVFVPHPLPDDDELDVSCAVRLPPR